MTTTTPAVTIVKTYELGDGRVAVVHYQDEPGRPTWELRYFITGRVEFEGANWLDGTPVDCPASSPVRKACAKVVRAWLRLVK